MKEQVLQVTKGDFVGSASGAVVLTALIVFLSSVLVQQKFFNKRKRRENERYERASITSNKR